MSKGNGRRPVNKTDGPKKLCKRALAKSRRNDESQEIQDSLDFSNHSDIPDGIFDYLLMGYRHKWERDEDVSICAHCDYVLDKRDDNVPPCKGTK